MTKNELLSDYIRKLKKSLTHLKYSSEKVQDFSTYVEEASEEVLEAWESLTVRFSRSVDIYLTKLIRLVVLKDDPGFQGTLRDYVDQAEKMGLVHSADEWMLFRGFRNIIVHEYEEEEMQQNLASLRQAAKKVLEIEKTLDQISS